MPKCAECQAVIADFDLYLAHVKSHPRPVAVAPVRVQPVQPVFANPGNHTLRDIAAQGMPSETFYLAANQSLIGMLTYFDGAGGYPAHTSFFKNMVATIVLETANREPGPGKERDYDFYLSWEIAKFNRLPKDVQLTVLSRLWDCCYRKETPHTPAGSMIDGAMTVVGNGSLPSSIRRVAGTGFFARIEAGPVANAWRRWKVGFRIDGGKDNATRDDLSRIAVEGCTALLKSPDLAVRVVKKYFHEHAASKGRDLYVGYQNRDLYNESGTCVSRSLLGATAFPYRHTHNNHAGPADAGGNLQFQYLFAIDCDGELGIDTEDLQIGMGNNSLWRPGEKAFAGFSSDRILGWTRIERLGQPRSPNAMSTGWSFKFIDSRWTWLRPPGGELQQYLEDELASWDPGVAYNIPETYDFQVNRS